MQDSQQNQASLVFLNRRRFLAGIGLISLSWQMSPAFPLAIAEGETGNLPSSNLKNTPDVYPVFVPYKIAKMGGTQELILRSGEIISIFIPKQVAENQRIRFSSLDNSQHDGKLEVHTLYDPDSEIHNKIFQEIEKAKWIKHQKNSSINRLRKVYKNIRDCQYCDDTAALELLDYVVQSSKLSEEIKARYKIASENNSIVGIEQSLRKALEQSELNREEQRELLKTFAFVRASEPVSNWDDLTDLDTIIFGSTLPMSVKQNYAQASATSRAYTADLLIVNYINQFADTQNASYLEVYQKIRNGEDLSDSDQAVANQLDKFLEKGNKTVNSKRQPLLAANAYAIYVIAREKTREKNDKLRTEKSKEWQESIAALINLTDQVTDKMEDSKRAGAAIVPLSTRLLSAVGVEAGTGIAISNLSGAAATNATLAWLGGGSVATGGLGMLGGLTVVTGGAALIGAAGLLSVALVAQMDAEDYQNLGVAMGTGVIAGLGATYAALTALTVFGVGEGLAGAAAISTLMAALGGVSVMTGGTALVAFAVGLLVWDALKANKKRDGSILKQLEARLYTVDEYFLGHPLYEYLVANEDKLKVGDYGIAPNVDLEKFSYALRNWLTIKPQDRVVAYIDTKGNDHEGVAFSRSGISWRKNDQMNFIKYQELANLLDSSLSSSMESSQTLNKMSHLLELLSIESEPTRHHDWVQLLRDVSHLEI